MKIRQRHHTHWFHDDLDPRIWHDGVSDKIWARTGGIAATRVDDLASPRQPLASQVGGSEAQLVVADILPRKEDG